MNRDVLRDFLPLVGRGQYFEAWSTIPQLIGTTTCPWCGQTAEMYDSGNIHCNLCEYSD